MEDEEEKEEGAVQVGVEEVEMLLSALRPRLARFAATAEEDSRDAAGESGEGRPQFVAWYREGQRKVLEQAVETLEEMMPEEEEKE